ncbi:MAG: hypothetical protein R3B70_42390 [Polyangiaceae bacterium]
MRCPARLVAPSVALFALLAPASASAIEFKDLGGLPLTVDVTNTAITSYRFDNRNDPYDGARKPDPSVTVDDNYFDYTNRLNVQLGYWRLRLNVRLDSQVYAGIVDSGNVVDRVVDETIGYGQEVDSNEVYDRANEYLRELNTRYRSGIYPAKLSLVYQQPGLEVTAGDFYAQLGRGLVLSVRKLDELAVDTTIRGGKVQASRSFGAWRVGGTLLGGQVNPQRVDEQTGRVLIGAESPMFFGFPAARPLRTLDGSTGQLVEEPTARPNFSTDTVVGGRIEGGHTFAQLSANALVLLRDENDLAATQNPAISAAQIRNFSGSVTIPQLSKYADLYVEAAGQQIVDREDVTTEGYAIYLNANARFGPLTVSFEGKHNRRFLALSAAVDTATVGYSAPQFSLLSYSAPPTAEPIYVQPVGVPNSCITGGRAQVQYRFNREASVYGWAGNYSSWTEYGDNNVSKCEEDENVRTDTWDSAIGADMGFEEGKSYAKVWIGARTTDLAVPTDGFVQVPGTTSVFYREGYVRYDLVKHLHGAFSLQTIGFHRHRYLPERYADPWMEGENYLALNWAPRLSAAFGFEYSSTPGCSRDAKIGEFCFFASGGLVWRGAASDGIWGQIFSSINLFVGQRRPAIRCVSGVCRLFPAFEGARLELVSRF